MRTKTKTPVDIYQIVTDQVIAKLSEGIIPWQRGYAIYAPKNYATGNSKEELIAELGSCFLLNVKGFDSDKQLENSTAYIESWLRALRNDKKLMVEAAAEAQKAVDYILTSVHSTR